MKPALSSPLCVLLLAVLLAGCGPLGLFGGGKLHDGISQTTPLHDGVTQTTPLVTGEVRLASGEPAANVRVTAYVSGYQVSAVGGSVTSVETRTDGSGKFRLVDAPLGMNTIEAEAAEDSKALRMQVAVEPGARLNLDPLVLQPTGTITGQVTAGGGVNLLGTTVFIPGTQYVAMTAENGTYTLRNVPVGTYEVAAMRQTYATVVVDGVTVQPQKTVQAPELALRLDAPVLDSLSQPNGGAGSELVLRGRNFGASKNTVLVVTFGNVQATRYERLSDTEIRVWVPDGAQSGAVVVRSNGVASNALSFQVIATLRLTPGYAALYVGDRQSFTVEALDSRGARVEQPALRWELGSPGAGTLDGEGMFLGNGEGWSEIRARSGRITGLAAVGVTRYQLSSRPLPFDSQQVRILAGSEGEDGSVVFSDWMRYRLYRVDAQGTLQHLAGTSVVAGFSPDGTPALEAVLRAPLGVVRDAEGNVFFGEADAHRIRVIPARDGSLFGRDVLAGRLYTLAGTGVPSFNGDGPALERAINTPRGMVLDLDGALIFVDAGNRRIRKLKRDGTLHTLVGGGAFPFIAEESDPLRFGENIGRLLVRDAVGNLYFYSTTASDEPRLVMFCRQAGAYFGKTRRAGTLYALTGPPGSGTFGDGPALQTPILTPQTLAVAASGELLFGDRSGRLVRRLDATGNLTTLAGAYLPTGMSGVPPFTLPAPATAPQLNFTFLQAASDGTLVIWDWATQWKLDPIR